MEKPQTRAVAKKSKKKLLWLGAQRLMAKPTTAQEEREKKIILLTAKVLDISPFGVNILGGLPYVNKLGLQQKVEQYRSGIQFKYEWEKVSQDDNDKAICKCKLVSNGKDLTDWVFGECSPSSIKMGTLKGYQNHMAQTRARNRAILEAFGLRIHEEMMENIEKLYQQEGITEGEAAQIGSATTTSAEEIQNAKKEQKQQAIFQNEPAKNAAGNLFAGETEKERIRKIGKEIGLKTVGDIEKKIGLKIDWKNMTKIQASKVLGELLMKKVSKKK